MAITYGDTLKAQAGKFNQAVVPSKPKPDQQPTHLMQAVPSSPKPGEQTQQSDHQIVPRGDYGPTYPYPTDVFSAHVEFARNIRKQNTFGQLAIHTVKQGVLYLANPTNANAVNPLIITGQIPGEGFIPTTVDAIIRDPIIVQAKSINDPTLGAKVRANIGQLEGQAFAPQFPPTFNQVLTQVADSVMGALGIKNDAAEAVQNPKSNSFQQRLIASNRLDPTMVSDDQLRFRSLYGVGYGGRSWRADAVTSEYWATTLGGVSKKTLADFYAPIDSSGEGSFDLSEDYRLSLRNEDGWKSNLGYADQINPEIQSAATVEQTEPVIADTNGSMIFPFYFQSLNTFVDTPEKYITFQATFTNLKEEYRPQWSPKHFFGRTTAVYIYEWTDRTISFDFIIHATERSQMGVLKQRINWLARHVYPSYMKLGKEDTSARIFFEAPIIKFTIGDLFRNTPGVIKSLTYDWSLDGNQRWELTKNMIMPQMVRASISIDILHDKFMQNSALAIDEQKESSDFYAFIKPEKRGIEPFTTTIVKEDKKLASFTPEEVDSFAGEKVYQQPAKQPPPTTNTQPLARQTPSKASKKSANFVERWNSWSILGGSK